MTNENKSDFKSYYPHINVTDYLSERARKMLHDRIARDHEYAETIVSALHTARRKHCILPKPAND